MNCEGYDLWDNVEGGDSWSVGRLVLCLIPSSRPSSKLKCHGSGMSVAEMRPEYVLVRVESGDDGISTYVEGRRPGFGRIVSEHGKIKSSSRICSGMRFL